MPANEFKLILIYVSLYSLTALFEFHFTNSSSSFLVDFTLLFVLPYVLAWLLYFQFAQLHNPNSVRIGSLALPYLPITPTRVLFICRALVGHLNFTLFGPLPRIAVHWVLYKREESKENLARVCLDVKYGTLDSQKLDIYYDTKQLGNRPVLIFVYGGSWNSGDKQSYALLGERFRDAGFVVVIPNYVLFPQGVIDDMTNDISNAIIWVYHNIHNYGGDVSQIILMGHSAGAHLCMLTVVQSTLHSIQESLQSSILPESLNLENLLTLDPRYLSDAFHPLPPPSPSTLFTANHNKIPKIRGLILIAGVYDIFRHFCFESSRGVEELSPMARIMPFCVRGFFLGSPAVMLESLDWNVVGSDRVRELMPEKILFIHGETDKTVPLSSSQRMYDILTNNIRADDCELVILPECDHSRPVIDLMLPATNFSNSFLKLISRFTAASDTN
ncbi:hypothetical protein HK098_002826 [Nowakowskiella sp. JEL0407]|nr:hypothetical protein HK098_002826 [Nowakowskiella sp. JEL0407]